MKKLLLKIKNWIRIDGLLHILFSTLILLFFDSFLPIWVANIITILIGIGKEIYDKVSKKGYAEWHDVICDIIGVGIGNIIGLLYMCF